MFIRSELKLRGLSSVITLGITGSVMFHDGHFTVLHVTVIVVVSRLHKTLQDILLKEKSNRNSIQPKHDR